MRLIMEPRVYLAARQDINDRGLEDFLLDHNVQGWETDSDVGAEIVMETAGRVCYMSFAKPRPGGNAAYLKHIKEVGHGSVLEHSVWNFIVTDVSRSLTHELVRHRAGFAYSQLSQRYVDESVAEYVVPKRLQDEVKAAIKYLEDLKISSVDDVRTQPAHDMDWISYSLTRCKDPATFAGLVWLRSIQQTTEDYRFLADYLNDKQKTIEYQNYLADPNSAFKVANLEAHTQDVWYASKPAEFKTNIRKEARGAARSVLTNATETKVFITVNGRALRHFIEMRGAAPAEAEIRHLAHKMWRIAVQECPNLFSDYMWTMAEDGTPLDVTTPYRKV